MSKTDIRSMYEKDYIGSWDLPEARDCTLIIDHVEQGSIQKAGSGKKEKKPLVFFRNVRDPKKPLVLNATNRETIRAIYGNYIEDWAGKPIAVYKTMVQAVGGGTTEGIRVRPTAPPMPKGREAQAQLGEVEREPGDERESA